jgi:hypothetical protein
MLRQLTVEFFRLRSLQGSLCKLMWLDSIVRLSVELPGHRITVEDRSLMEQDSRRLCRRNIYVLR